MEQEEADNVLDLRVARWRNDPFIVQMLEIIEKLSRYGGEEKAWALIRMKIYLRTVERELAQKAKTEG
jgi:hypothetical protein